MATTNNEDAVPFNVELDNEFTDDVDIISKYILHIVIKLCCLFGLQMAPRTEMFIMSSVPRCI